MKFFLEYNSHLINLECISKYMKGKGGYITMIDGTYFEVSTRRKEAFFRGLDKIKFLAYS